MDRTCLGDLVLLVDDALLKALCLCDIIDLLHVEQTCKYLRFLASHSEVWYAVVSRLPREIYPSILPGQRAEETDLRSLIVRAFRGYRNWTSDSPEPIWSRSVAVRPQHCSRMLTDAQFIPGGNFFLYFADETLYCFDVVRNNYVLERRNPFVELLSSGFELHPDRNILTVCLIGRSTANSVMSIKIELSELDLQSGNFILIREFVKPWSDLCEGAGGGHIMPKLPIVRGHRIAVPYLRMESQSLEMSDGAMILDFTRNTVLFLSLRCFSGGDPVRTSSITIVGGHLLFVTGLGTFDLTINSVSLTHFETCWQPVAGESPWTHHNVLPVHVDASLSLRTPGSMPIPPTSVRLSVHASTWLDLDLARRRHPSAVSVSLIDAVFVCRDAEEAISESRATFLQLQFAELEPAQNKYQPSPQAASGTIGSFIAAEQEGSPERVALPKRQPFPFEVPTRTGRIVAGKRDDGVTHLMAAQGNAPRWTPLQHLTGKYVRHYILDYYSDIALRSSQMRGESSVESSAEIVVEGYD